MTKIYTRTGDLGKTRLIGGTAVSKSDGRLEAYGGVDELNSTLGVCHSFLKRHANEALLHTSAYATFTEEVQTIQNQLFFIGSRLACEDENLRAQLPMLPENAIVNLEDRIDEWTAQLPELKEFILPGGHLVASQIHVCRTVCRRSERAVARVMEESEKADHELELRYLNRLSDYLFTASRFINQCLGEIDHTWKKDAQ